MDFLYKSFILDHFTKYRRMSDHPLYGPNSVT